MAQTIVGVFANREDATGAINELKEMDYSPKDFSIIMKDTRDSHEFANATGTDVAGGAVSGALIGGLAGLVASFLIPGIGAFFIGGPLAAGLGLTGAAATTTSGIATGALAGGILGALGSFGIHDNDARYYEERINQGGVFVAVPVTDTEAQEVSDVFSTYHAGQIQSVTNDREETFYRPTRQDYTGPYAYAGAKGGKSKKVVKSDVDEEPSGKKIKKIKEIEYE